MKQLTTRAFRQLISPTILFLTLSIHSFAQTSTVNVNLSTQQVLPPDFMGYDCPNINKGQSLVTPNYVAHIPLLLPKVIRYPGNSSWFDWKRGWYSTSPLVPTKLKNLPQQPNYLENFKIVLDSCHARAMFTLNMITATLQDQIAMLKHADSIGIPVKYVELGNEIYAASTSPDAPEGSDVVDSIFPTGQSYAIVANMWIDTIHHYFPNAKVSIVGNFEKLTGGREGIWNDSVKKYISGREDAWTYHVYMKSNPDDTTVAIDMDDMRIWMSRPDFAMGILNSSMAKRTPGKEAWITEYNNDDFYRPTVGRWAHGLYMGTITLKYLENSYVTNLTAHAVSGSAIYGQFFDDNMGFSISEAGDSTYATYDNPPPTTPWGLSASGRVMQMISQAAYGKNFTSRLTFSPNHRLTVTTSDGTQTFDGIYGRVFVSATGSDAIIFNVSDSAYVLNTSTLFPAGSTYKLISGDPLALIATDADVSTTTGTLSSSLTLPAYSVVKITSTFVPSAAPAVQLTVNGSTSLCAGDSVKLDAGDGYAYYLWSNGATSRTIWAKSTGDYWAIATNSLTGYWGGDTVHIIVHPLPATTNLQLIGGPHSFCLGTDTTILHPITVYPANTQFLWNSGETTMDKSVMTTGGNFYVTVIDSNGCRSISETENVTVYPLPTPTVTVVGPTQFCSNQNTLLIAPAGFLTYNWSNGMHGDTLSVSSSNTYNVSVKDANGCWGNSTNSIPITVWTPPVPTITVNNGPSSYCAGTPVYLSTISGYVYQWQVANANISGATNSTQTPTTGGTYKVIITDTHGCTQASLGQSITIWNNPVPVINVSGGTSICQGQSTLLSASNTGYLSYLWSTGATSTSINVSTTGTYSLTVTDGNGCVGSAVPKVITVNPLPTPSISAGGPTEFCSGSNVVLSANQTYNSVAWSPSGFGQTKTVSTSGTYYCTVTDANGCNGTSNSISVNVHALPSPQVTSSSGSMTFCSNAGVYLSTTTTGYNYQWFKGATSLAGATTQSYSPAITATYKLKITDAMGCSASSSAISVTVNPAPAPGITGPTTICSGNPATLSANTTFTTYSWSTGETTQSVSVTQSGTYSLTVTNTYGCSGTASTTLQAGAATVPVLSASGPTDFCSGGSIVISTIPSTYNSYSWSNSKVTSTITVSSTGNYTCIVTDANGCTATSAPMAVNVHTLPAPNVISSSGQTTFCDNTGVYLSNDAVGYNYQWFKGAAALTGETNQNYLTPSTGSYKVQITDNIGCSSTAAPLAITVNAHPTPTITGATFICGANPVTISTSNTYLTYLWSTNESTQSISVNAAGNYSVTVTDVNGCSGSASTNLQSGSAAVPILSASGPTEFCNPGSVTLSTTQAFSSYSWSNSKTTATISVSSSGSYTCTVTDANGCTAVSAPMAVNVHTLAVPVVSTSTGATTWCTSEPVYLTTDAAGYSYQWFRASTLQTGATDQNYTPTVTGKYKVRITDNIGCSSTSSLLSITINSSLLPTITGTPVVCNGNSTVLSANTIYSTYLWSTGATTQSISVNTAGTYSLTVTNSSGCSGSTSVTVSSSSITLPTVSTSGATEFCSGGSVTLSISPTTYSSYLWSNGNTTSSITANSSGTYSCTVTNSSGCSAVTSPVAVNVHAVATPTATTSTGQTTYCSNAGVYLTTSSVGYNYQWFKGTNAQTGATNQNYTPTAGGNYKVRITDNIGCSATSGVLSVTINSAPAPSITGVTTVCGSSPILISANIAYATYLWSTGATTQSISVSAAGTYTLTVSNTNGCTGSTSATVQAGSAVIPVLSASGATEFCNGGSVTLSTVPATYSSYSWSNAKTTSTIAVTTSGSYSCTVSDALGCTATSAPLSVNVHTLSAPVVTTNSGATTFCDNAGVYLTTSTTGYSYQWLKGTIVQTGETNQNYSPVVNGNYKVQINDNLGCSATSNTLSITINASTIPGITGAGTICNGSSETLTADNIYSSYLWSTGATTQSISVTTPGTYSLTITNTSGCTGSATTTVNSGSATVPTIISSGPTEFCSGGSDTLRTSPSTYSSYVWSNTKTTSTIVVNSTGNYSCTVTDPSGCTAVSAPIAITVHSVTTPVVTSSTGQTTFCASAGVYLTTSSVGYNYQWFKGTAAQTGATNQNFYPSVTGGYKVRISDNIGCSATSASFSVTVNAAPAPSITGATNICSGNVVTISANTAYNSYLWSTGATTQSINVSAAGTYTLTVTNAGGCTGSTSRIMTVSTPPSPTITASGPTSFCDGGSVTLTANPVSSSYLWSDGKVSQTDVANVSGTWSVTVTDANGCTGTSAVTAVTEWAIPSTTITVTGPTTFCSGANLCTLSGPSGYNYQWKKGSTLLTGETNQTYVPTASSTYKLTTTDIHGCSATSGTGVGVTVNNNPNASISTPGSLNICNPQTKTMNANTGNGLTYQWKKDGTDIYAATGASYTTSVGGSFTCFETNVNGCTALSNALVITTNCKEEDDGQMQLPAISSVQLYPNPASGVVHIEAEFAGQNDGEAVIEIHDIVGALVYSEKAGVSSGKMEQNIQFGEAFSSGVYFLRVRMNDESVIKRFVIVNKEK